MTRKGGAVVDYGPVGPELQNGFDNGGSRFYPYSRGLAVTPPSMYGNYIGSGQGIPVMPPVAALSATAGTGPAMTKAELMPFGKWSPLPWVLLALVLIPLALYHTHYKK